MAIWIAAMLLITAVALFVAAPLSDQVSNEDRPASEAESERREHEHSLAVQALRELEFDYAMGKLDADDYHALRLRLEIRALATMSKRVKSSRHSSLGLVGPAVPLSHSVAAAPDNINFCSQCGTRSVDAHNFCPNCGAGRPAPPTGI